MPPKLRPPHAKTPLGAVFGDILHGSTFGDFTPQAKDLALSQSPRILDLSMEHGRAC